MLRKICQAPYQETIRNYAEIHQIVLESEFATLLRPEHTYVV